jgi:hypothetical protein
MLHKMDTGLQIQWGYLETIVEVQRGTAFPPRAVTAPPAHSLVTAAQPPNILTAQIYARAVMKISCSFI